MKINNKGQALIEFILILPIILFLILAFIDVGNVLIKKNELSNDLDTVATMYQNSNLEEIEKYVSENNEKIKYELTGNYNKITLSKLIKINMPIIREIFGKSVEIKESRTVIANEK